MGNLEICWESALALGERIRAGEISAVEATRAFLDAIGRYNGPINAVVTLDAEGALRRAAEADRRLRGGELDASPLAGVPFLAKDLDITAGVRTTFGSVIYRDYVPSWDMLHISRLKEAGCVLLGKTNTPEGGTMPNTYNDVFGPTRNPWNLERCAGGSSGGSGAAVAAGLAPLATGSDGGGSIRIPASINGVFGHKPTFGLVPFGPKGIGILNTIGHLGPMTRSVADAAAMLDAMAGGDERDRSSLPRSGSLLAALDAEPDLQRVGYSSDLGLAEVEDDVRELFMTAIEALREAGWPLEEAAPRLPDPRDAFRVIMLVEWGTIPLKLKEDDPDHFALQTEDVRRFAEGRARLTLDDFWEACRVRRNVSVAMGEFFERYDLLLTPSLPRGAFEVDLPWPRRRDDPDAEDRGLNSMLYPFNLTGDPACSIPMGLTSEGLPAGLQIVGPRHEDARVLQAAQAYERLSAFTDQRPPHGVKI